MSIKGVEKLVEEMSGGREPIKTFGEKMKAELAEVDMTDVAVETGEDEAGPDAVPDKPLTEGLGTKLPQEEGEE